MQKVWIRHFEHFRACERGQALVLTALAMVVLLMMAGLGVDVGYLRYQKQQMQKAADAGAIAAADAMEYNGNWLAAAQNEAAANGFQNGVSGITVTVNNPPQSGPFSGSTYSGDGNFVEVIVVQARPTFFMQVAGFTSVNVRARAVAALTQPASGCIYVLDRTVNNAFVASGGSTVNAQCGIWDDSSSATNAFVVSGGQTNVSASYIGVVGGANDGGTVSPNPTTGIAVFSDPLAYLPEPVTAPVQCPSSQGPTSWPAECTYSQTGGLQCNSSTSTPIQAATYCGGITINGSGTTVHFGADSHGNTMFILAGGGLAIQGGANGITDTGVTFFNTYGTNNDAYSPIVISGGSSTYFKAPTSGTYQGILFFQDRNIPSNDKGSSGPQNTVSGQSGAYFEGTLYFPSTPLVFSGGSSTTSSPYTEIVADTLTISGSSAFNDPAKSGGLAGIKTATMVE